MHSVFEHTVSRLQELKLITNADDLGASPAVNAAIFGLMDEGLVTSATILANAPAMEDACRESARYNGRSFGVHLNLTEYKPLTNEPRLGKLMAQGRGDGPARDAKTLRPLRQPIFQEWCAQVERIQSLGIAVSHIDSHHHIHTVPTLFPVLKAVQERFNIRKVRLSKNIYTLQERPCTLFRLKKTLFNSALRLWHSTATTDAFTDLAGFQENRGLIEKLGWAVEIMLHPGGLGSESESEQLRDLALGDSCFKPSLVSYDALKS